jgi:hypothetical protein
VATRGESVRYVRYLRLRPSGPGDEHPSEGGVATQMPTSDSVWPLAWCSGCVKLRRVISTKI